MRRGARAALSLVFAVAATAPAAAQVPDHLKCYRIKDPAAKARYTVDLVPGVPLPPEIGCRVSVPGKLLCVPASKTNVSPPPPGGGATGTPNAFVCYKAKCPPGAIPPVQVQDQFGARAVQPSKAQLLCAPAIPPSTTTTTMPLPSCGSSPFPVCNGTCPPGDPPCVAINAPDFTGCACPPVQCGTFPTCGGPCPPGKVCVAFSLPGFEICACSEPPP